MPRRLILTVFTLIILLTLPGLASAKRIVAMGDLHGDLGATRKALRLAGAIDEVDRWIGGDLIVVQTGDHQDFLDPMGHQLIEAPESLAAVTGASAFGK